MKKDEIRIESTSFQSYTHLQKNINLFLLQKKHSRTNLNSLTTTVYQCLCEHYKHITKTRHRFNSDNNIQNAAFKQSFKQMPMQLKKQISFHSFHEGNIH